MPKKNTKTPRRKPRTDALRNRERILQVAKEAFTRFGATASLDDMAKKSGVGPGTLYRHFPTRDILIEAVYRSEVEKLAAAERKFSETMPPLDALRAWMLLVVDFVAAKRIIAPALNSVAGGSTKLFEGSRALIQAANDALIKRAIDSGDLRSDVDPPDLLLALIGASHMSPGPQWHQSGRRLVEILIRGTRFRSDPNRTPEKQT